MPATIKKESFSKNPRQREAIELLNENMHTLLYGGSRSGKTFIIIRNIVLRALKAQSRHLVIRLRYSHVKISILQDTFPKVMKICFPNIPYKINLGDMFVTVPAPNGEESTIWFAGSDDPARVERVLGNEYSSIFANEISQIAWETILVMWTRLAENSGLDLKFYYDCNPPSTKHWAYTLFFKSETPKGEPITVPIDVNDLSKGKKPIETVNMLMNPTDNPHLQPEYLAILHSMPKRHRDRFLAGVFLDDVEGALWDEAMLNAARGRVPGQIVETVVAVDPAVSHTADSDECGMVVCSRDELGGGIVHQDATERLPVDKWARRSVDLYHQYKANAIVAEVNQGGDLVASIIHNVDPTVPVYNVSASKSKWARAEPIAQLYAEGQNRITHDGHFVELEEELTTYVPRDAKFSPNRLDALVWGLTYLLGSGADIFDIAGG